MVVRYTQDLPGHYTFKIKPFSFILESNIEKIETDDFEVGGCNWKLELYPNGNNNKVKDNRGHVSLYLAIAEPEDIYFGWEFSVLVKFFVYDHIRDRFQVFNYQKYEHFHMSKPDAGRERLVSHDELNDTSLGYLADDCFSVGVEIVLMKPPHHCPKRNPRGGSFSLVKRPGNALISWEVYPHARFVSEVFHVEGSAWKVMFYPSGDKGSGSGTACFHLILQDDDSKAKRKRVFGKYTMRLRDRRRDEKNRHHHEVAGEFVSGAATPILCFPDSIARDDLEKGGYLAACSNTVIIEVEFHCVSSTKCTGNPQKPLPWTAVVNSTQAAA